MTKPRPKAAVAATKHPTPPTANKEVGGKRAADQAAESTSQFTLKMRTSLHQELARMAFERDMTMRGFIMKALKAKGLSVTDSDLVDRRKR